jgi:hypothetical protein
MAFVPDGSEVVDVDAAAAHRAARVVGKGERSPLDELVELIDALDLPDGAGDGDDYGTVVERCREDGRALQWVNKWGTLGVGIHDVDEIWLWPRRDADGVAIQERYLRRVGLWHRYYEDTPRGERAPLRQNERVGAFARDRDTRGIEWRALTTTLAPFFNEPLDDWRRGIGRPAVEMQELEARNVEVRRAVVEQLSFRRGRCRRAPAVDGSASLRRRIGARVYDDVRDEYPYPVPGSDAWALAYSEGIYDFISRARDVRDAFYGLANRRPWSALDDAGKKELRRTQAILDDLIAPSQRGVDIDVHGNVRERWRCPTLLATLGLMLRDDAAAGRVGRRCERRSCGRAFAAKPSQRFCSEACRHASEVTRWDQKRRALRRTKRR